MVKRIEFALISKEMLELAMSMDYMQQALSLARLALGQVSPNPAVGAVLVKGNRIVGQGFTQPPGYDHAEVVALKQAGGEARNSTLYVTLEPCCHQGRTPPCTRALITARIREVHIATTDPNPLVSGKGQEALEKSGIRTYTGEHEAETKELIEAYAKFITTGIPFVTAKFAMSLDGKIATKSGDSRWISGEESRRHVHNLRFSSDAIMAGANTVIRDNPHLTARCCGGRGGAVRIQPLRVVVDGKCRTPPSAQIFKEPGGTLLVLGRAMTKAERTSFSGTGTETLSLPADNEQVDLKKLLQLLGQRGISSVLVEGGSVLFGSLFDAGLIDKVIVFISPVIIGGREAKTAVAGSGVDNIADACKLESIKIERYGEDLMLSGYIKERQCSPAS